MQALLEQTLMCELHGHRLNPRQVNTWFIGLAKAQRSDLACCVLSALRAVGAEIDRVHYSAAVSGCGKGRRWQLALRLLADMALVTVEMDVIAYSAAISACEKGQQWQLALGLLAGMAFVKVDKDVIAYNAAGVWAVGGDDLPES